MGEILSPEAAICGEQRTLTTGFHHRCLKPRLVGRSIGAGLSDVETALTELADYSVPSNYQQAFGAGCTNGRCDVRGYFRGST